MKKNKNFKNHECPQLQMNYATRVFAFFCLVFLKPYLLDPNFHLKLERECSLYTGKSYCIMEKTLTLVTCLLYDLADEREHQVETTALSLMYVAIRNTPEQLQLAK